MPIVRLIHVNVDPSQAADAERIWKEDCGPRMLAQKGCKSEQLLKCMETPGEYISYAEWESQEDIDRYREGEDHQTIQTHARALQGARAVVKRYEAID